MRKISTVAAILCCLLMIVSCGKQEPAIEATPAVTEEPVTLELKSSLETEPVTSSDSPESNRSYSVDTSVSSCIEIDGGNTISLSNISVDQVDTGSRCQDILNLIRVTGQSSFTLLSGSVTASASATNGLFAENAQAQVDTGAFLVSGTDSSCVHSSNGSTVSLANSTFLSETDSSSCLLIEASSVSCSGCDLSGTISLSLKNGGVVSLSNTKAVGSVFYSGFDNEVNLDNSTLEGTLEPQAETCDLILRLANGSTFTGSTIENTGTGVSVSLDGTSTWNLTSDAYVDGFSVENGKVDKILSNGYHIYYNSEHEDCAWLNSKSLDLPLGGTLSPLI